MWNRVEKFIALVLVIFLTVSSISILEVWAEQEVQAEQTEEVEQPESTESVEPTEPAEPTESEEPTEPAEPTKSVEPTEPAEPTESVELTEPTEGDIPQELVQASGNGIGLFSVGDITITFDGAARINYTSVAVNGDRDVEVFVEGETITKVVWTSDKPNVVAIAGDKDGALLEAKSIGVATITATITTNVGTKIKNVMITTRESISAIGGYANADIDLHNAANATSNLSRVLPEGDSFEIRGSSGNYYWIYHNGTHLFGLKSKVNIPAVGVILGKNYVALKKDERETLQEEVEPELYTGTTSWSSSNTSVATINQNGRVTAVKEGATKVHVTAEKQSGNIQASSTISVWTQLNEMAATISKNTNGKDGATSDSSTVKSLAKNTLIKVVGQCGSYYYVKLEDSSLCFVEKSAVNILAISISLNSTSVTIEKGKTYQLVAKILSEMTTDKKVVWSSDNSNVVKVDSNGKITGVNHGVAYVYAKTSDGRQVASSVISVWAEVAQAVAITSKTVDAKKGAASDSALAGNILSNTGVTVVGQCGNYYYVRKWDGSLVFIEKTALRIPVKSIELDFEETTIGIGQIYQFSADVAPELATDKSLNWSSSNANIVTIDKNGKMVALKVGYAYIEAKSSDGLVVAKCSVNVQTTPVYDFASIRSVNILGFEVDYDCVIMSFEANAKGDVDASYHIVFMDEKGKTAYKQSNMYGETNIEMHYIMEGFDYNKSFTVQISASYMRNGKKETKSSKKLAFKTQKPYLSLRLKKIAKSSFDLKIDAMPEEYYDKLEIYYRKKGAGQYNRLAKKYYEVGEDIIRINKELIAGQTYEFEARLIKNKKVICKDKVKVTKGYTDLKANSKKPYTKINLSWKKIAFASGYEIYRSEKKGVLGEKIQTIKKVNTTSYSDSTKSLKKGKKYYYKIYTYGTQGKKTYKVGSNQVEIVCKK